MSRLQLPFGFLGSSSVIEVGLILHPSLEEPGDRESSIKTHKTKKFRIP